MKIHYWRAALAAGLGVTFAATGTVAPVKPETPATLSIEYEFVSSGDDAATGLRWSVRRVVTVQSTLVAAAPVALSASKPAAPERERKLAEQQTRATRAAGNMQPLMADAMAIYERCGEDEACIEREVQKAGFGMEVTPQLDSARADIAALGDEGPPRYQSWVPRSEALRYALTESQHLIDGDPICHDRPNKACTRKASSQGSGELPGSNESGMSSVEIDLEEGTMTLRLRPVYGALAAVEVVETDQPGQRSGSTDVLRRFTADMEAFTIPFDGSLKRQSGERTVAMRDDLTGRPGELIARWSFSTH